MKTNVVSLRGEAPNPLAELFAERDRLGQELARLGVVDTRASEAEGRLAEVEQGISALDRADRESVEQWASGGGEGDAPQPLLTERRALLARRLDIQAEADAARVAVDAVAARRVELIGKVNAIGLRVRERQLAAALDQGRRIHAEALKLADELGAKLQDVMGLRQAIISLTTEAARRNDADHGRALNIALAEVDALPRPEILADPATVDAHAAKWMEGLR